MIKSIIFDMDGVLVDNSEMHVVSFMEWCKRRKIECTPETFDSLFGLGNEDIMKVVMKNPNLSKEDAALYGEEKEQIYRDMISPIIKPVDGLLEIIQEFKAMGLTIAVGSSGMSKNVDFVLEKCGITQYFDAIANGDMISKAKPDPEVFLLAAKLLGREPHECLVFEDSFAGVAAARAAGMKVVALTTTYPREDHKDYDAIIDNFTQITAQQIVNL